MNVIPLVYVEVLDYRDEGPDNPLDDEPVVSENPEYRKCRAGSKRAALLEQGMANEQQKGGSWSI
jgi:hypothetical protein